MNIQEFIENNIQLIDNNEYKKLYALISDTSITDAQISELTRVLLAAGIDPLDYMSTIPTMYASYLPIKSVDIPSTIEHIEDRAFEHCHNLTSVVLPQSVKTIDDFAFYTCENLQRCVLPASLLRIGVGVFYKCSKLTRVIYLGTMEQFQEIDTDNRWAAGTTAQIECIDGVLARVWEEDRFKYQRIS